MKAFFRRHSLLIGCGLLLTILSACVTERHDVLRSSAASLDRASDHFVKQIHYRGYDSHRERLNRDAEILARSAHKLDVDVDLGESRPLLAEDYRHVEESYDELHRQLADEGYAEQDHMVLEDFDRVSSAYHDVQSAMMRYTSTADIR